MIQNKIHDDADVVLLRFLREMLEVFQGSIHRVDIFVIRDVIAEIELRRWITRRNPNGIHAEVFQVIEFRGDAVEVADAIAIAVGEAAGINFIENGMLPPRVDCRICTPVLRAGKRQCKADGHNQQSYAPKSAKHGASKHGASEHGLSKPGLSKHGASLPVMPKAEIQDAPTLQQNEGWSRAAGSSGHASPVTLAGNCMRMLKTELRRLTGSGFPGRCQAPPDTGATAG